MTNAYVTLDTLKGSGVLNITGTGDDARLLALIEAVSRVIDRYCGRHFYSMKSAKRFDGNGGVSLLVPDLISIDSGGLKTDDNKDRSFETTWATTDYLLLPTNADPTNSDDPEARPYSRIEVDRDAGSKASFPSGRELVQVTGEWGYRRHLKRAAETADAIADATTNSVTVSARTDVEAGHTLLVDSEQLYVKSYSGNTLTVARGVNGTAAATHSGGTVIDIYRRPGPIVEAAIMQSARLWRRKDSAFSNFTGFPETGQARIAVGIDADVAMLLGQYRKLPVGVSI